MLIRNATIDDAASIANIHIQTWQAAYQHFMPQDFLASLSLDKKTQEWAKELSHSLGTTLIIEQENIPVGFCVFGPARDKELVNKNAGELVALNILPKYWSKGFGSAATKYMIDESKKRDWQALYLWVIKENARARAVYEKLGFIADETEKVDSTLTGHKLHEIRYRIAISKNE